MLKETAPRPEGYVHPIHRYTQSEVRLKKRRQKEMRKEMKAKEKEEQEQKSVWNLDSTPCTELDLTFRLVVIESK